MTNANFKPHAFSLVELLVALIVVSCIIAAFAPVMTKRLNREIGIIKGSSKNHKLFLTSTMGCTRTTNSDGRSFSVCNFTVPKGVTEISAVVVGSGEGGGGAAKGVDETYYLDSTATKQIKSVNFPNEGIDPDDVHDIKIEQLVGGGGGGGGGYVGIGAPTSQADCDPYDAYYTNGLCITKTSINPNSVSTTGITKYASASTQCSNAACCWSQYQIGGTSGANQLYSCEAYMDGSSRMCRLRICSSPTSCSQTSNYDYYSDINMDGNYDFSCSKGQSICAQLIAESKGTPGTIYNYPTCNSSAAYTVCNLYKTSKDTSTGNWRLPRSGEINITAAMQNELNFCTSSTCPKSEVVLPMNPYSTGTPYCYTYRTYGMDNQSRAFCDPASFWLNDRAYYTPGYGVQNEGADSIGLSVRCVRDYVPKNFGGGGGALGTVIKNVNISDHVPDCKIQIISIQTGDIAKAGYYTSGGSAVSAQNGTYSKVYVDGRTSGGNSCYQEYVAYGGEGGKNATQYSYGQAGKYKCDPNYGTCSSETPDYSTLGYVYKVGNLTEKFSISSYVLNPYRIATDGSSTQGGLGGQFVSSTYSLCGGSHVYNGCAGNENTNDGGVGVNCGATVGCVGGGGGGYAGGSGGFGYSGSIRVSYKMTLQGASGGGGYSGSVIHAKNFPVTPGQVCRVEVAFGGKGGAGGLTPADGEPGYSSRINCGNSTITSGYKYHWSGYTMGKAQTNSTAAVPGGRAGAGANSGAITIKNSSENFSFDLSPLATKEIKNKIIYKNAEIVYFASKYDAAKYAGSAFNTSTGIGAGGNAESVFGYVEKICGGFNKNDGCDNQNQDGVSLHDKFKKPGDLYDNEQIYGSAGAGGAGGGWKKEGNIAGDGGDGQDGYVYIYWDEP